MQSSFRQPTTCRKEEGSITITTHLKILLVNISTFFRLRVGRLLCSFLKELVVVVATAAAAVAALPPRSALIADNPGLEISRIRKSL